MDSLWTQRPEFVRGLSKVCPKYVHVQCLSKHCPYNLGKSNICPTFVQDKSTVCPRIVYTKQLCPNNFTLDTPWTQDFLRFVQTLSTRNPSLPAPHQTSVLHPSFFRIQCLSRQKIADKNASNLCPDLVQAIFLQTQNEMSTVCPCPMFVQTLSRQIFDNPETRILPSIIQEHQGSHQLFGTVYPTCLAHEEKAIPHTVASEPRLDIY